MNSPQDAFTNELLQSLKSGSEPDDMLEAMYDDLHRVAEGFMRRENPAHTLNPTGLVHEAYLRLVDQSRVDWRGQSHFMSLAATMIRRILVDHARRKKSEKRGGQYARVTLEDDSAEASPLNSLDVLALNDALEKLHGESPRIANIVDLKVFGGLEVKQIAEKLGVSERTVKGDWALAKAWLGREMKGGRG